MEGQLRCPSLFVNTMKILKICLLSIMIVLGLFSVSCFLYPTISNIINEHYNESTINEYESNVDSVSETEITTRFAQAIQYNQIIATDYFNDEKTEYERILNNYNDILNFGNGLIGYVEIPSISVKLPFYHGESEEVLKKGAAHLEQTSFPIGGLNTHACISAHSGYPTQKFFDDIDELESGDFVYIKILNRTITYKVSGSEVIEPTESSKLKVEKGKDYLTLITCYPYGINSHRLLVHAEHVNSRELESATSDEIKTRTNSKRNQYIPIIWLVIGCTAFLLIIGLIILQKKKRARK